MQATITYLLTEQAQRAQMVATGQPVARKQTMRVEVPAADLDLYDVDAVGTATLNIADSSTRQNAWLGGRFHLHLFDAPQTPESLAALMRAGIAALAEAERVAAELTHANGEHNRAITEAAHQRYMADPSARFIYPTTIRDYVGDLRSPADYWPESHSEFVAEIRRRDQAAIAAALASKDAAERAKEDFIACWVRDLGDEELSDQFEDGLACRKTILSMIATAAFATAGIPGEISVPDPCDNRGCPCCDNAVDCLPRKVYAVWRSIKAGLPAGSTADFRKVRECERDENWDGDGDGAGPAYYTATITMPHGPFQFTRRIKLEA